jgi:hypothetical protein
MHGSWLVEKQKTFCGVEAATTMTAIDRCLVVVHSL